MSKKNMVLLVAVVVVVAAGVWMLKCNETGNEVLPQTLAGAEGGGVDPEQPSETALREEGLVAAAPKASGNGTLVAETGGPKSVDCAKLRPVVQEVLSGDNYNDRLRAVVHNMPARLDRLEYGALAEYLLTPQDGKDGDFRQHEYALRNYMMDSMRGEQNRLGETIGAFAGIYRNKAQGEVMRNYALQHLASVYIDNASTLSSGDKSRIVRTLRGALDDTSAESLAGTALVGLQDASRWDEKTVSSASVGNAAMKFLRDENSSDLSRISAFQVGGELKLKSVGSYARETAFDANADWTLRMSAVYALGQLGETDGLDTLLNDSNQHVKNAALAALNME